MKQDVGASFLDSEAALSFAARKAPQITYTPLRTVCRDAVDVMAMFTASDQEGNDTALHIEDILDESGQSIFCREKDDGSSFVFPSAGIYTVVVKAKDRENKEAFGRYRLLVAAG